MLPDNHGDVHGAYYLSSLYYDSPNHHCYWEKVNGIPFRRKLRIRRYETTERLNEKTPVYVEIKKHIVQVVQKRRVLLPWTSARLLCNERKAPAHDSSEDGVVGEILNMIRQFDLRPTSLIRYSRQALDGIDKDSNLRVTFDRDLTYHTNPTQPFKLGLKQDQTGLLPLFPANLVIIEIKVNERIPGWLAGLVSQHDLEPVSFSKYCRSIEIAQDLP
ncbi:MAG: polyphosphate polymerase domain-containing protein, partial [Anaerolineaceae bacterium]|nr:polyphosphate polymerase domain-containing protein [Anaerolineaceae bacterium]